MDSYITLNPQQRKRCVLLMNFFTEGDKAVQLTKLLTSHGSNSFKDVLFKIQGITMASEADKKLQDALYGRFQIGTEYTIETIVATVLETRRSLHLQHFVSDLEKQCIEAVTNLFIVKTREPDGAPRLNKNGKVIKSKLKAGYTPIFSLKP